MPRPLFTPGKDPVPIVQEAGWAPGPVWTGAENLTPTGIRFPDRPACSQSLYRLRYPAHNVFSTSLKLRSAEDMRDLGFLKRCCSRFRYSEMLLCLLGSSYRRFGLTSQGQAVLVVYRKDVTILNP